MAKASPANGVPSRRYEKEGRKFQAHGGEITRRLGAGGGIPGSSDSSTSEEGEHDHDDGDHEQEMDQPTADVEREQPEGPQNEQDQSDGQKHDRFSLRDTSLVCDFPTFTR